MVRALLAILLTGIGSVAQACDSFYLSPIAFSHHWVQGDWNEVHPGITVECRKGQAYLSTGQMKNSLDRSVSFVSSGAILPINSWASLRLGAIMGHYDNTRYNANFTGPMVALALWDDKRVAADIMHVPANGFSPVPVTLVAVRFKLL